MKREASIDYHIKSTWHAIARMYNQKAATVDKLTTSIGFVLINVSSTEGTPVTKIGPMMGLESRSLTRIVKTMEENGLIYKQADLADKRSVRIFLTEEGIRLKGLSVKTVKTFNHKIRQMLTAEELETFFRVFDKINQVIENER